MHSTSTMETHGAAGRAGLRYRWTWPHVADAPEVAGPGYAVELTIYGGVIGLFAIPVVQSATGVSLVAIATILVIHGAWLVFTRTVLAPRAGTSRRVFDAMVFGNAALGTGLSTAFAVLGDAPATLMWGLLILYATSNGAIRDFDPSIVLQLIHVSIPLTSIPLFHAGDPGPWSIAGPVLAAAFAAIGYHLLATQNARSRMHRQDVERKLADAERAAADGRLARDLHDVMGSTLGTVKLYADVLAGSNANIAAPLSDVARAGLDDLRAMLDALAPPGDGGVESTLDAIAQRIRPSGIDVRVRGTWPVQMTGVARVALARVAQEAIWNAIKHGGATSVELVGETDARGVRLAIRDNGRGFQAPVRLAEGSAPKHIGRGLAAMHARATELGGTFAIESAVGAGTAVAVTLPAGRYVQPTPSR